jgi:4-hydroxy-tetrahydrodipicolinate reductase
MKIALVGYGKMGHMVEAAAKRLGHGVALTVDPAAPDAMAKLPVGDGAGLADAIKKSGAQGVIEFSRPEAAPANIAALLPLGIPLVVGTTGWKDKEAAVAALAAETGGVVLRSANFSLGVNLFYRIVSEAARLFADFDEYDCAVWEAHHNQKADSPSGTALEIARRILAESKKKTKTLTGAPQRRPEPDELTVSSTRVGGAPGAHTVFFDSEADTVTLTHTARSREGFASGAVRSLERLSALLAAGRLPRGRLYSMDDVLFFSCGLARQKP